MLRILTLMLPILHILLRLGRQRPSLSGDEDPSLGTRPTEQGTEKTGSRQEPNEARNTEEKWARIIDAWRGLRCESGPSTRLDKLEKAGRNARTGEACRFRAIDG